MKIGSSAEKSFQEQSNVFEMNDDMESNQRKKHIIGNNKGFVKKKRSEQPKPNIMMRASFMSPNQTAIQELDDSHMN